MLNDSIDEYEQVAPHNEESSLQTDVYTVSDQNQLWPDVEFPGQETSGGWYSGQIISIQPNDLTLEC